MPSRWRWAIAHVTRKLWFRATLFSIFAVAAALLALIIEPVMPGFLPVSSIADSVDGLLAILASSMLTVTVFSVTAMVSAYSSAASNITPRATRVLLADTTSQNALSTFLGAFLFSLVAIVVLATGAYGPSGRMVLFIATLITIVLITITLLRWISHLSTFGLAGDTIERVEQATLEALRRRRQAPTLGAERAVPIPAHAVAICPQKVGYIQNVDVASLGKICESGARIHVAQLPGSIAHPASPVAWYEGPAHRSPGEGRCDGDDAHASIREAFAIAPMRSFDQDPRFGLMVLSEIASRALSPAVNDPGTAIAVIVSQLRLLQYWIRQEPAQADPVHRRVHVPALSIDDLFDDAFAPIARDGAGIVEVAARLQKSLAMLAASGDEPVRRAARRTSARALKLSNGALPLDSDRLILTRLAQKLVSED